MIKLLIIILTSINLSAGFKSERTQKISPLSDTIIFLEKQKKNNVSNITTLSARKNLFNTFNQKNSSQKKWEVKFNSYGIPSLLSGDKTKRYYGSIEEIAKTFLEENKELLGIDTKNLRFSKKSSFLQTQHIEYQQYYKDIPVDFSYVRIHSNSDGEISQYNAKYYPYITAETKPMITFENAKSAISRELGFFSVLTYSLVIFPDELNDKYYLSYKIKTKGGSGALNGQWVYYIDANNGNVLFKYDERQYACTLQQETTGFVYAQVYEISPMPTGTESGPSSWLPKITTPVVNQYVFAGGNTLSTTTRANGEYCIEYGGSGAKVFMTTMGPYFSVMNFNGQPSFYTNTTYEWRSSTTPLSINSYPNNSEVIYTISPSYSLASTETLAFVEPIFSSFNVGKIDNCGSGIDNDMVYVMDSSNNVVTAWFGQNKSNLFGGLVPSSSYKIKIKSDQLSSGNFNITVSSYLVIQDYQKANNETGSITWSTNNYLTDEYGASINAFYHLNRIRDFMMKFNSKCGGSHGCINLDRRVPVMIEVQGDKTTYDCWQDNTMWNAFYDLEHDAIFFGKGIENGGYYKDFALDGTVLRHEYGHLVMNRVYPMIYFGEFGAISEAIADYFSLSSFWDEGKTLTALGNFIGVGEGTTRDLSTVTKKMPDDWVGEVHDDSLFLSGAFYKLRKSTDGAGCDVNTGNNCTYNLGKFSSGAYLGLYKADLYIFGTLFYFPDNFENFMYAMLDLCKNIEGLNCDSDNITNAFRDSGIPVTSNDLYEPNNGPEYATNISTINEITAYIDYPGDEDYYIIPLKEGLFHARLYLPQSSYPQLYHAYSLFLFDSKRNYIKDASPDPVASLCYSENLPNNCLTTANYVDLYYNVDKSQIYYLVVSGSLPGYNNGKDCDETSPYKLNYEFQNTSVVNAEIKNRKVDADEIEFSAYVPKFEYINDPNPPTNNGTNWTNGSEFKVSEDNYEDKFDYNCIKILDNNLREISTNYIDVTPIIGETSYNLTDSGGRDVIKGKITLKSYNSKTISQAYPYLGTIYIKIYAKNHMFNVGKNDNYVFLGISNPINLTSDKNDFVSYNNIINNNNSAMTLKYESKEQSNIKISVYTATGHKVKTIYDGPAIGKITFNWDGTDDSGSKLASGIYYIKTEGAINKVEKVGIVR